jgi:hypothetical protein
MARRTEPCIRHDSEAGGLTDRDDAALDRFSGIVIAVQPTASAAGRLAIAWARAVGIDHLNERRAVLRTRPCA